MDIDGAIDRLREQLTVAAAGGGEEARELAQRLATALEPAVRLTLLEVLSGAAAEITRELAPGSVEVRLREDGPEFVVTPPPAEAPEGAGPDDGPAGAGAAAAEAGEVARINLRLPEGLKARVEAAADRAGLSTNAWLVRAVAAFVEREERGPRAGGDRMRGGQRYTGWAR